MSSSHVSHTIQIISTALHSGYNTMQGINLPLYGLMTLFCAATCQSILKKRAPVGGFPPSNIIRPARRAEGQAGSGTPAVLLAGCCGVQTARESTAELLNSSPVSAAPPCRRGRMAAGCSRREQQPPATSRMRAAGRGGEATPSASVERRRTPAEASTAASGCCAGSSDGRGARSRSRSGHRPSSVRVPGCVLEPRVGSDGDCSSHSSQWT